MMYADDIVLLFSSLNELSKGAKIIKEWAATNNIHVNKRKSGMLEVPVRLKARKFKLITAEEHQGFPVVLQYKYFGTLMDGSIRLDAHRAYINRKISWITARITRARILKDTRFNINIFMMLI
jgi:hypothetical protein